MPSELERPILQCLESKRFDEGLALLLRLHGPAFFAYIRAMLKEESLSADAYQLFSIRLWQALPNFEGRSSLKTWCLRIARNAALRTAADPFRQRGQALLTQDEEKLAALSRSQTAEWLRTEVKSKLSMAIQALAPEDRELLALRLGQRLSWRELAMVLSEEELDESALERAAANARKRFQRLKLKLSTSLER
ncbi:MAG: sigma-70 family RNA polymerase sigma factor [Myxococcota bacterium]|jgi:RNA polymerase sigma-70 factor (ECF subfamily)|nr:sigma-70 family RNA polymerase sigma factor [Myxococcota bacterium]